MAVDHTVVRPTGVRVPHLAQVPFGLDSLVVKRFIGNELSVGPIPTPGSLKKGGNILWQVKVNKGLKLRLFVLFAKTEIIQQPAIKLIHRRRLN